MSTNSKSSLARVFIKTVTLMSCTTLAVVLIALSNHGKFLPMAPGPTLLHHPATRSTPISSHMKVPQLLDSNQVKNENSSSYKSLQLTTGKLERSYDSNTHLIPRLTGYVLADRYPDQLTGAMGTFYQLTEIASHWNMKTVEPQISSKKAGLTGIPQPGEKCFSFRELYNISAVHKELDRCLVLGGQEPTYSFQGFLVNAVERNFISLTFIGSGNKATEARELPGVFDCTNSQSNGNASTLLRLEQKLNGYLENNTTIRHNVESFHGEKYKFKGVQAICVNGWNFSIDQLTSQIVASAKNLSQSQDDTPPSLTVVLPHWTAIQTIKKQSMYYYDPSFSWKRSDGCDRAIPPGQRIISAEKAFSRSLNISHTFLGIHIRIEKLASAWRRQPKFWHDCIRELEPTVRSLQSKYGLSEGNMVAIQDLGKFGTSTKCPNFTCAYIKAGIFRTLHRLGVRVINYNPTEFGEPADKAFVSLVEKEFLSRADYLLTVGWGTFQRSLIAAFLKKRSNSDFHVKICDFVPILYRQW